MKLLKMNPLVKASLDAAPSGMFLDTARVNASLGALSSLQRRQALFAGRYCCDPLRPWTIWVSRLVLYSSVSPVLAYIRCSVFVDWINEPDRSVNEQMNNPWTMNLPEGICARVFEKTDMSNTPKARHSLMLSGCHITTEAKASSQDACVCLTLHCRPRGRQPALLPLC